MQEVVETHANGDEQPVERLVQGKCRNTCESLKTEEQCWSRVATLLCAFTTEKASMMNGLKMKMREDETFDVCCQEDESNKWQRQRKSRLDEGRSMMLANME